MFMAIVTGISSATMVSLASWLVSLASLHQSKKRKVKSVFFLVGTWRLAFVRYRLFFSDTLMHY